MIRRYLPHKKKLKPKTLNFSAFIQVKHTVGLVRTTVRLPPESDVLESGDLESGGKDRPGIEQSLKQVSLFHFMLGASGNKVPRTIG